MSRQRTGLVPIQPPNQRRLPVRSARSLSRLNSLIWRHPVGDDGNVRRADGSREPCHEGSRPQPTGPHERGANGAVAPDKVFGWPRLSEGRSPGDAGEAGAHLLATHEFVANREAAVTAPLERCIAGADGQPWPCRSAWAGGVPTRDPRPLVARLPSFRVDAVVPRRWRDGSSSSAPAARCVSRRVLAIPGKASALPRQRLAPASGAEAAAGVVIALILCTLRGHYRLSHKHAQLYASCASWTILTMSHVTDVTRAPLRHNTSSIDAVAGESHLDQEQAF